MSKIQRNKRYVVLSPMAGVTDWAFRTVCRETANVVTVTEMTSAKGIHYGDGKTKRLLRLSGGIQGAQIFGSDPVCVGEAAAYVSELGFDFVDINMGCPTPKIVKNGDGCALMRDPDKAFNVIAAAVKHAKKPVTVKFRRGWDKGCINAAGFAVMCESAGVAGVCVHGRTRAQMYSGAAMWDECAEIRRETRLIVGVNGDIDSPEAAVRALRFTDANAVLIGRAAMGNPLLLRRIRQTLDGETVTKHDISEHFKLLRRQILLCVEDKGEKTAIRETRKFFGWYLSALPNRRKFTSEIIKMETLKDAEIMLNRVSQFSTVQ